jgi:2-polyprenyl-3-methyl-5-hydroxy-6-metoxy-1,4-benzoquinol methylase
MMETAFCALCGSTMAETVLERADRFSGERFRLQRCCECGLHYVNPRPDADEIAAYYPEHYEPYQVLAGTRPLATWRARQGQQIKRRFVEAHAQTGRLLDVGCATGDFLGHMASHGWEVQGIEISPRAAQIARERYGIRVHAGRLAEADLPAGSLDVVTLWDVIEHLHDPPAELRRIHSLLAPDGLLVLTIPNLQSWDRRLFGVHWIGWDVPRHLYAFPREPLARMVAEAGLEIVERRCILGGVGAFLLSYGDWVNSLNPGAPRRTFRFLAPALPWLLWPYKELAYRFGRGPVETIACVKR